MTAQEFFNHVDVLGPGSGPKTSRWWKILVPICLCYLNCTKFDQLILRKIIKIITTSFQILRQKCSEFDGSWGSTPDPAGGAYSAPDPLTGFKGAASRQGGEEMGKGRRDGCGWRGREGGEKGKGDRGNGRDGEGKEG